MRRRDLLSLGAGAVALPGCVGLATEDAGDTTGTATGPTTGDAPGTEPPWSDVATTSIGGSVHGRPWRIGDDLRLIERSETRWLHAFLDVRKKYESDVAPAEDPDVLALRRASRETGAKLFVTLQWNFIGIFGEQPHVHMPEAGSTRESALLQYATDLLAAIDEPVEIVGLGNEPVWETLDEDIVDDGGPLARFTRKVKERVVEHYTLGEPRLLVGAFNRLYSEYVRDKYWDLYRRLFEMARTDDDVAGIDLHVHYQTIDQARRVLEFARGQVPDGMVTATEFSPVWRYDNHKNEPIAGYQGGERFAERYGIDRDTTVTEYLEAAKYDRLPRQEMADFYDAMPWYNVNFVDDMYRLLDEFGVEVGTFGFVVEDDVKQLDWTDEWAPFPINCLFQPALIDTEDGAHPHYLDDFQDRV